MKQPQRARGSGDRGGGNAGARGDDEFAGQDALIRQVGREGGHRPLAGITKRARGWRFVFPRFCGAGRVVVEPGGRRGPVRCMMHRARPAVGGGARRVIDGNVVARGFLLVSRWLVRGAAILRYERRQGRRLEHEPGSHEATETSAQRDHPRVSLADDVHPGKCVAKRAANLQ